MSLPVFKINHENLPLDVHHLQSSLYWIFLDIPGADPRLSGYVGVCSGGTSKRWTQHQQSASSGSQLPVHRAIRKYGERVKVRTLALADPEFCLLLENALRPVPNMKGTWNVAIGGVSSPTTGTNLSEETRRKIGAANSGTNNFWYGKKMPAASSEKKSIALSGKNNPMFGIKQPDEVLLKISKASWNVGSTEAIAEYKELMDRESAYKAWRAPNSKKEMWADAQQLYEVFKGAGSCGQAMLSTLVKGKYSKSQLATPVKNFRNGWVPADDHDWLTWCASFKQDGKGKTPKLPWQNSAANKDLWASAIDAHSAYVGKFNSSVGAARLGREIGFTEAATAHLCRKLKAGWNPSNDEEYIAWRSAYNTKEPYGT